MQLESAVTTQIGKSLGTVKKIEVKKVFHPDTGNLALPRAVQQVG